jgi:hypothetical protein
MTDEQRKHLRDWHSCGKHPGMFWAGDTMCYQCRKEHEREIAFLYQKFEELLHEQRKEFCR